MRPAVFVSVFAGFRSSWPLVLYDTGDPLLWDALFVETSYSSGGDTDWRSKGQRKQRPAHTATNGVREALAQGTDRNIPGCKRGYRLREGGGGNLSCRVLAERRSIFSEGVPVVG